MRKAVLLILVLVLVCAMVTGVSCGTAEQAAKTNGNDSAQQGDSLFQFSTTLALEAGIYDCDMTIGELQEHGDFGIGTFNGLDGELIGINGDFFQVKVDGNPQEVEENTKTPFAMVTFFESDKNVPLAKVGSFDQLKMSIENVLPTRNIFYALKIKGEFDYVKARSVPRQEKPYVGLEQVIAQQQEFELRDVKGTVVGFWSPVFVYGINVPGAHLHFISDDENSGGHILDCVMNSGELELDYLGDLDLKLPLTEEYFMIDFESSAPQ